MRHGKKDNHLSRTKAHRGALMRNLAIALIRHKRINTTLAKAKALRGFIEPLVTKARNNTTHSRRVVFSYLQNKEAAQELFGPVAAKVGERPGGYVRVLRTGFRRGDAAEMAMIEFVDFNEVYVIEKGGAAAPEQKEKDTGKKRSRRGGKGGGKAAGGATAVVETITPDETIEEAVETAANEAVEDVEEAAEEVVEAVEEAAAEAEETPADEAGASSEKEEEQK